MAEYDEGAVAVRRPKGSGTAAWILLVLVAVAAGGAVFLLWSRLTVTESLLKQTQSARKAAVDQMHQALEDQKVLRTRAEAAEADGKQMAQQRDEAVSQKATLTQALADKDAAIAKLKVQGKSGKKRRR